MQIRNRRINNKDCISKLKILSAVITLCSRFEIRWMPGKKDRQGSFLPEELSNFMSSKSKTGTWIAMVQYSISLPETYIHAMHGLTDTLWWHQRRANQCQWSVNIITKSLYTRTLRRRTSAEPNKSEENRTKTKLISRIPSRKIRTLGVDGSVRMKSKYFLIPCVWSECLARAARAKERNRIQTEEEEGSTFYGGTEHRKQRTNCLF